MIYHLKLIRVKYLGFLALMAPVRQQPLRMIATLIKPDAGDIFVNGYSAVRNAHDVRKHIGFNKRIKKLEDFFTPNYLFDFFANLHGVDEKK